MSQECPICRAHVEESPRYPRYICDSCAERVTDAEGRRLKLFQTGPFGGYAAAYADNSETYDSNEVYVNGVACWAEEARFGGIVIQPR